MLRDRRRATAYPTDATREIVVPTMRACAVISVVAMLTTSAACEPATRGCVQDSDCVALTPRCAPRRATCSRPCEDASDCAGLSVQTTCDWAEGLCSWPCTESEINLYECRGGERAYCDDPSVAVPCTICPNDCAWGTYCDGRACQQVRSAGEPCTDNRQCQTTACTMAGFCSVANDAPCTPETCAGTCRGAGTRDSRCERASGP